MSDPKNILLVDPVEQRGEIAPQVNRRSDLERGDDRAAIAAWLGEYRRKANTLRAYEREARRFYLWLTTERRKTLGDLSRQDLADYDQFLSSPPSSWLPGRSEQPEGTKRPWVPLKAPLGAPARRQTLVILQVMLEYLCQEGYLDRNPARLIRDKGPAPTRKRRLIPDAKALLQALEGLQRHVETVVEPEARALARRDAFVWSWVYWTGARRHELAHALLGSIFQRLHRGQIQWWWTVDGKGELQAHIPVDPAAMTSLAWFAATRDLQAHLTAAADKALVTRLRSGASVTVLPSEIYASVRRGAAWIEAHGASQLGLNPQEVEAFAQTRPHDLRAARATHLLDEGRDLRYVQRLMRHSDINTTMLYDHTGDARFHEGMLGTREHLDVRQSGR